MKRLFRGLALAALVATLGLSARASAQHDAAAEPGAPAADSHVASSEGDGHGEGHGHAPTFDDINWFHGFLGEKEGVEPGLLWRPKGMPVPFGALALNALILYALLFKFGKKPIVQALRQRQQSIMKGMSDAAKMKADAERRLAEYERKLADIDQEVERIRREMKEAGESERARIVSEAKERRTRMERDARTLIEQELKAAREELMRDTVRAAVKAAETRLLAQIGDADQQRLSEEYLGSIQRAGTALRGRL